MNLRISTFLLSALILLISNLFFGQSTHIEKQDSISYTAADSNELDLQNLLSTIVFKNLNEVPHTADIEFEIIPILSDRPINLLAPFEILVLKEVIVLSDYFNKTIYLIDRNTGTVKMEIWPIMDDDPNCFDSNDMITKRGDSYFEVYDSFKRKIYIYDSSGSLIHQTYVPFGYNDVIYLRDSIHLYDIYGLNNDHITIDSLSALEHTFITTKLFENTRLYKRVSSQVSRMSDYGGGNRFFHFPNGNVGHFHPFRDTIIVFNSEMEIFDIPLDFSGEGGFASLFSNTVIIDRLSHAMQEGLIWIDNIDVSDNLMYINYAKGGRERYLAVYDYVESNFIYHSDRIRTPDMPPTFGFGLGIGEFVEDHSFVSILFYPKINQQLKNIEDAELQKKVVSYLESKGLYMQDKDFDSKNDLLSTNPVILISKFVF